MKKWMMNLEAIETEFRYGVGMYMHNRDNEWFQNFKREVKSTWKLSDEEFTGIWNQFVEEYNEKVA